MTYAHETAADGEFKISARTIGWERSEDFDNPCGAERELLPDKYRVKGEIRLVEVVDTTSERRGLGNLAEHVYVLAIGEGEDVLVSSLGGTFTPAN